MVLFTGESCPMIDLPSIAANSLWILGLAVVLAALSWANWEAKTARGRLRQALATPSIGRALDFGLALFCAGLAGVARPGWERALWGALAVLWLARMFWSFWDKRRHP